jgi:hypothetical protein
MENSVKWIEKVYESSEYKMLRKIYENKDVQEKKQVILRVGVNHSGGSIGRNGYLRI